MSPLTLISGSVLRINKSVQTMDAKDLILDSLDERSATYVKKAKRCRDDFSTDAVHDLRTSIRRLLAILEVVAFMTSGSKIEKLSDRLEDQLDGFSDLRDIHVMLDQLEKDVTTLPELEPFQNYLEKREKRRQRQDQKHVQNIKLVEFMVNGSSDRCRLPRQALSGEERSRVEKLLRYALASRASLIMHPPAAE